MTAQTNAYNAYKQNSVTTASPGELTLMLYNGCLKFLNRAKTAINDKNIAISVVIEGGREEFTVAADVARRVFDKCYIKFLQNWNKIPWLSTNLIVYYNQ